MTQLVTDRLIIRWARDEDLASLFSVFSNPKAMQYWSNLPHKTQADTRATLEKLKNPGQKNYFVFEHAENVIGLGGIHTGTEIGFILHPDYWRRGFASEALNAIIDHIWATTDFDKITADADPLNRGSVAILTHLGFQVSGFAKSTFCVGGHWSDSVYFALPRPSAR